MELKIIVNDIEIISRIVSKWNDTGNIDDLERQYALRLLAGIQSGIDSCADQELPVVEESNPEASRAEVFNRLAEEETISEIPNLIPIPEEMPDAPQEDARQAGVEPESTEVCATAKKLLNKEPGQEPARASMRHRMLDRDILKSLYEEAGCEIPETPETKKQPDEDWTVPEVEQQPVQTNTASQTQRATTVLGEVINNGSQVIGETMKNGDAPVVGKIASITEGIGINDRYLIATELFNGDTEEYSAAIADLDRFGEIEEAMLYIYDKGWDSDSEAVKSLAGLLIRKLM